MSVAPMLVNIVCRWCGTERPGALTHVDVGHSPVQQAPRKSGTGRAGQCYRKRHADRVDVASHEARQILHFRGSKSDRRTGCQSVPLHVVTNHGGPDGI